MVRLLYPQGGEPCGRLRCLYWLLTPKLPPHLTDIKFAAAVSTVQWHPPSHCHSTGLVLRPSPAGPATSNSPAETAFGFDRPRVLARCRMLVPGMPPKQGRFVSSCEGRVLGAVGLHGGCQLDGLFLGPFPKYHTMATVISGRIKSD